MVRELLERQSRHASGAIYGIAVGTWWAICSAIIT